MDELSGLWFAPATRVATAQGEQPIGTLHPGQKVLAYNPKTHTMELEPILHVWINHDHDLVDLTLTTRTKATHGHAATTTSEVLHTNERHPFLTVEKGFLPVSQLRLGMHIERANGGVGVVTKEQMVPGAKVMYNLEVAQDHTYAVGDGQWVVHNCGGTVASKVLEGDAYRAANKAGKLVLRLRDAEVGTNGLVKTGLSHFDRMVSFLKGDFFKLPAGTVAPDGLQFVSEWRPNLGAYHIGLEPIGDMTREVYDGLAEQLRSLYQPVGHP